MDRVSFEDIDLDLEKLVFLWNAYEGNPGIYELTYELGKYNLKIEDKYKIAHDLLSLITKESLVVLEKFTDMSLSEKIETVSLENVEDVINNPSNWYPCNEVYSISLTKKGEEFMNNEIEKDEENFRKRLFGK